MQDVYKRQIKSGKIVAGDVVVIRYEGPKGGPVMREMLNPTSAIAGMGLGSSVAPVSYTHLDVYKRQGRFAEYKKQKLDSMATPLE